MEIGEALAAPLPEGIRPVKGSDLATTMPVCRSEGAGSPGVTPLLWSEFPPICSIHVKVVLCNAALIGFAWLVYRFRCQKFTLVQLSMARAGVNVIAPRQNAQY
jgi:hypothetical protein